MKKKIILIAGLPASGKDTVADIFNQKDYFLMTYSTQVLKPIIENPQSELDKFIKKTIGNLPIEEIEKISKKINHFNSTQTGRELYITVAQYLNKVCSILSQNTYNHFTLFATAFYGAKEKVVVAGFRQKPELDILNSKYPDAIIKTIFVECNNELRYERLKLRDNIDKKTIQENEKYELETTHNLMMSEIKFNYSIKNNGTLEELKTQTKNLIEKINKL